MDRPAIKSDAKKIRQKLENTAVSMVVKEQSAKHIEIRRSDLAGVRPNADRLDAPSIQ